MNDISRDLQDRVREAGARGAALRIVGGDTKAFYGREPWGEPLEVSAHRGVVAYEPTELVITVRGGTPLAAVESVLAEHGQMLAFEPPRLGETSTAGGTVAAGLSGPRRPFSGSLRDHVLGCKVLNGRGEILSFGGQVMKNVAGYDLSRLMVGAMGTLGVVLEVSFKVLPAPQEETTVCFDLGAVEAINAMNRWAGLPLPLSGLCWDGERVYARVTGSERTVAAAQARLGGERLEEAGAFWDALRDLRLPFFRSEQNLWRVSVAPAMPKLPLSGRWLYDWGGAQRWLLSDEPADRIFAAAAQAGGHATLFRGADRSAAVFQPLPPKHMMLQKNLKRAFDPSAIFNPKRLYPDW